MVVKHILFARINFFKKLILIKSMGGDEMLLLPAVLIQLIQRIIYAAVFNAQYSAVRLFGPL